MSEVNDLGYYAAGWFREGWIGCRCEWSDDLCVVRDLAWGHRRPSGGLRRFEDAKVRGNSTAAQPHESDQDLP